MTFTHAARATRTSRPLCRSSDARTTPAFTCKARLNDWPPTNETGHTSAPCLVQGFVVRPYGLSNQLFTIAVIPPSIMSVTPILAHLAEEKPLPCMNSDECSSRNSPPRCQ